MVQKIDRASIKMQAKQQLKGKVWMLFLCTLVASAISGVAAQIPVRLADATDGDLGFLLVGSLVYLAIMIFVTIPVSVGLTKVYLNVTYGYQPSVSTLFEPFSKFYSNSILTPLLTGLIELLWYIPFLILQIVLGTLIFAGAFATMGEEVAALVAELILYQRLPDSGDFWLIAGLFCGVYLIILLVAIPYAVIVNAYAQTTYVLCEYPDYSPTQCIKASKAMMKGHRWELFVLGLSFIPWLLLVSVTCGIAGIYVGPYMTLTYTNFYHRIKDGYVGNNPYNNNGGYGQPQAPYGQPYDQQAQAPYGQPYDQQAQAPYGQPYDQQPQAPYGQPYDQTQAPEQPQYDPNATYGQAPEAPAPEQFVQNTADAFENTVDQAASSVERTVDQAASDTQEALDQASHDMMTNFDDYTDNNSSGQE